MQNTADELKEVIAKIFPLLEKIDDSSASTKPAPGKWSKKEIIGHLIDSACNNQQKFVRTMLAKNLDFTGYQQDDWVSIQRYQEQSWQELLLFWKHYNLHIAHLIENVQPVLLQNSISINGEGPFTLEFIMIDYVEHLKHHLKQVLPDNDYLKSNFKNVY